MKNFDVDQIKNRQRYKMPDLFFERVQQRVVDETNLQEHSNTAVNTGTKFKNWYLAVAAGIALIFGGTVLLQNEEIPISNSIANHDLKSQGSTSDPLNSSSAISFRKAMSAESNKNAASSTETEEKFTGIKVDQAKNSGPIIVSGMQSKKTLNTGSELSAKVQKSPDAEDKIDILLASFSAEELAMLAKNSDQDVYLDLYN